MISAIQVFYYNIRKQKLIIEVKLTQDTPVLVPIYCSNYAKSLVCLPF